MATSSGYTFNQLSRIGMDDCNLSQTDIQNTASCNYLTQNFFASDCTMRRPIDFAVSQPGVMYKGGHMVGAGGCNINDSSKLQIGTIQTHPKCRIDLFHRPFATVPFLGRGSVNPVMEAQLMQGELFTNKKSVNPLAEKSYIKYHQTPLLPAIQQKFDNSAHKIESDASDGWVRGGLPSRELTRDAEYSNAHSSFR